MIQHSCKAICACCGRRCNLLVDGHSTHRRAGGHEFTRLAFEGQTSFPKTNEIDVAAQLRTDSLLESGVASWEWQRRSRRAAQKRDKRAAAKAGQEP